VRLGQQRQACAHFCWQVPPNDLERFAGQEAGLSQDTSPAAGARAATPQSPDHQNASQIAIALLGDRPELLLAASRILARPSPIQPRSHGPTGKIFGSVTVAVMAVRTDDAIPGMVSTRWLSSHTRCCAMDPLLDRSDQRLHCLKFCSQHNQYRVSVSRQALILIAPQ